jgi:hypothetical protein
MPRRGDGRTDEVEEAFVLDRLGLRSADRLEVTGRWSGVRGQDLSRPTLVLVRDGRPERLAALPQTLRARGAERDPWRATFPWRGGDLDYVSAQLEFGSGLVVELPGPLNRSRRFGRQLLPVRQPDGAPPASGPERLRLHAELVAAREVAEEAREGQRKATEEARRARVDAGREQEQRRAESQRLHQGLDTLRGLAEEALATEREVTREAGEALAAAEAQLETEQHAAVDARRERDAAVQARRRHAEETSERLTALEQQLAVLRRERETAQTLRKDLASARHAAQAAAEQAAQAVRERDEARATAAAAADRAEQVLAALAQARRRAQDADSRATRLQSHHDELRQALTRIQGVLGDGAATPPATGE